MKRFRAEYVILPIVIIFSFASGFLVDRMYTWQHAEELAAAKQAASWTSPTPIPVTARDPLHLFTLVNDFREQNGLARLKFDDRLCSFAKTRLDEIHSDWSHQQFLVKDHHAVCNNCAWLGENLARGYDTDEETVDGWENSPGHRANMLKAAYTNTCIATDVAPDGSKDGNGELNSFVVQIFSSNF